MGAREFVLAIIVIVLLYKLLDSYLRNRAGKREAHLEQEAHDALSRVGELEERVRVLERIVTDEGYDVRREFRDLGRRRGPDA